MHVISRSVNIRRTNMKTFVGHLWNIPSAYCREKKDRYYLLYWTWCLDTLDWDITKSYHVRILLNYVSYSLIWRTTHAICVCLAEKTLTSNILKSTEMNVVKVIQRCYWSNLHSSLITKTNTNVPLISFLLYSVLLFSSPVPLDVMDLNSHL